MNHQSLLYIFNSDIRLFKIGWTRHFQKYYFIDMTHKWRSSTNVLFWSTETSRNFILWAFCLVNPDNRFCKDHFTLSEFNGIKSFIVHLFKHMSSKNPFSTIRDRKIIWISYEFANKTKHHHNTITSKRNVLEKLWLKCQSCSFIDKILYCKWLFQNTYTLTLKVCLLTGYWSSWATLDKRYSVAAAAKKNNDHSLKN